MMWEPMSIMLPAFWNFPVQAQKSCFGTRPRTESNPPGVPPRAFDSFCERHVRHSGSVSQTNWTSELITFKLLLQARVMDKAQGDNGVESS